MPSRLLLVLLLTLGVSETTLAKPAEAQAELTRLGDEIENLISRNHWKGVERTYKKMLAIKEVNIPPEYHLAGAQAAQSRGDMTQTYERLLSAVPDTFDRSRAAGPREQCVNMMTTIEASYGRVSIRVANDRVPALVRFEMPFAREARKTYEVGREQLREEGKLDALLPVGRYMVDGEFFNVEAGSGVQKVSIGNIDAAASP